MNRYLRPFLLAVLVPGCVGGTDEEDSATTGDTATLALDDIVCFTVDLGADCPEGQDAKDAYEGYELCEDPVRTVLTVGDLVSTGVVLQTAYGGTSPAETADTGNIRSSCCYEAATETDPNSACTPGRPYTTEGITYVSGAEERADWCGPQQPAVLGLRPSERVELADAWLADGLAEHASIPAFGRVAVELAAHGAPPELLARCAEAMADEVRHAQACFALASAYAGRPRGPGPVAAPPRPVPSLVELAVETFREGCVGESLAAGRAAVQLAQASDPAVRAVLAMIVDDETRHAELAWEILRWAVEVGGAEVRQALADAARELAVPSPVPGPAVASHGLPESAEVTRVLRQMVDRVIEPSVRDLLAA